MNTPAKIILRECCSFIGGHPAVSQRNASSADRSEEIGCQGLRLRHTKTRGADIRTYRSDAKTKLVDAKLEMVRAGRLFERSGVVRGFCRVSGPHRIQRGEIDRRL
jgi:hypothetical protein